jgi:hypothetical protein
MLKPYVTPLMPRALQTRLGEFLSGKAIPSHISNVGSATKRP